MLLRKKNNKEKQRAVCGVLEINCPAGRKYVGGAGGKPVSPPSTPSARSDALPNVWLRIFTRIFRPLDCKNSIRCSVNCPPATEGGLYQPGFPETVSPGPAPGTPTAGMFSTCNCRNLIHSACKNGNLQDLPKTAQPVKTRTIL